jgi:curved DNA-binding protein CbpA
MENDLRRWMRLVEGMSYAEALEIFKRAGIKADTMTAKQLKAARNKAAPRLHPDTGGSDAAMQQFNAAYDVLKDQAGRGSTSEPFARGSSYESEPFDAGQEGDDFRDEWSLHFAIAAALHGTVHPFDKYQGPYVLVSGQKLWISPDDDDPDFFIVFNENTRDLSEPFWPHDKNAERNAIEAARSVLPKASPRSARL